MIEVTKEDVDCFLIRMKDSVNKGRFKVDRSKNRQANRDLAFNYLVNDVEILLSLEVNDFCKADKNKNVKFPDEVIDVFRKEVLLTHRMHGAPQKVKLYIKFNEVEDRYFIVISLHEQKYEIRYAFK